MLRSDYLPRIRHSQDHRFQYQYRFQFHLFLYHHLGLLFMLLCPRRGIIIVIGIIIETITIDKIERHFHRYHCDNSGDGPNHKGNPPAPGFNLTFFPATVEESRRQEQPKAGLQSVSHTEMKNRNHGDHAWQSHSYR